jgi:hypothetical protein
VHSTECDHEFITTLSLCFVAAALLHSSSAFCVYNYGAQTIAVMDADAGNKLNALGFLDSSQSSMFGANGGVAIKPNDKTVSSSQFPLIA